jgi:hypothetical protein
MFFASRILMGAKKLPYITSKRGNKNFYKGRGAPALGRHTKDGMYPYMIDRIILIILPYPKKQLL